MNTPNRTPGRFVWHEIFTTNRMKTKQFYSEIAGWSFETSTNYGMEYTVASKDGMPIGGVLPIEMIDNPDVPPHWTGYVSVLDVDETVAAARANGGNIIVEPKPVGDDVMRFAVIQDPQGAVLSILANGEGDPPIQEAPPMGTFCWNQLSTNDVDGAADFYEKVLGWKKEQMPGSEGLFVLSTGGRQDAGLIASAGEVPPHWMSFLVVDELAGARDKAVALGANVIAPEIPVPGIGVFAIVVDNVGAMIALFQAAR